MLILDEQLTTAPHTSDVQTPVRWDRVHAAQQKVERGDYDKITNAQLASIVSWSFGFDTREDAPHSA